MSNLLRDPSVQVVPSIDESATSVAPPDVLLQASRRIDWRFLLPDPTLGRVACLGPASESLVHSLSLFSDSLTMVDLRLEEKVSVGRHNLVVAGDPGRASLAQALELILPGGFLYIEAGGYFRPLWSRLRSRKNGMTETGTPSENSRPRTAAGYVAVLGQLGFEDIRSHWHWPDFETCTKIIPLDNRATLMHTLGQGGQGTSKRLRAKVGKLLLDSGLLARSVPCFSVVARRQIA